MKNIPKHIGIILDGNRRWARKRGLTTFQGHKKGFDNLRTISTYAFEQGVDILTVYAFSTENWNRSKKEVGYLMKLFKSLVKREANYLFKKDIKLKIFGRVNDFDKELQKGIKEAEKKTKDCKSGILNVCLSYGGREEIVEAVKKIIKKKVPASKINQELISNNIYSKNIPDPDIIIRTSGEQRLSGFLTWQSVYSELYFPKVDWPSFSKKDLDKAINVYNKRQRRFGGN